jgi:nicotinamide/nicotinate riboside kinase
VKRRSNRDGYVTVEGFWTDPPGYVEKIVWPNYVASHEWLFQDGVVEGGELDTNVLEREGIHALATEKEDVEFGRTLEWAVGVVMGELERIVLGGSVEEGGGVDGGK